MSVAEARRLAGPGALIGKSTHSWEQAISSTSESPDYIGFGPLFATPTKPDYTPIGTEQIRRVHAELKLPIFCIGGIKLGNLPSVLDAGARRVVIVSDLLLAEDPAAHTASCLRLLEDEHQTDT
jgi:thiamine-phosphate pyrophosphorylase